MKFVDLNSQYQKIRHSIDQAISAVISEGNFIMGKEVEEFEKLFADYCGVKHCVSLNSGTDALFLALEAIGIKAGDEVITSPFTMFAVIEAIIRCGARPVFADIDRENFNLDPAKVIEKINRSTKAIIPVHLFGFPADMGAFLEISEKYKISIIEDVAQATGAEYKNKKVGSFSGIGCFSFFPTKNLGAFGDGGAITTNDNEIADKIKILRVHGARKKYIHEFIGLNSRLDTIQAAILKINLKYLDGWNEARRKKAEYYDQGFKNNRFITIPPVLKGYSGVYHQYTIRANDRDKLAADLKSRGIPTMQYYPQALHLQPVLENLNYKVGDFPKAEEACHEVLSLPIYPELANDDQEIIIQSINNFYQSYDEK